MGLDSTLISQLHGNVDEGIIKKLDQHESFDDLDTLKLIWQLYTFGYNSKKDKLGLTDPFEMTTDERKVDPNNSWEEQASNFTDKELLRKIGEIVSFCKVVHRDTVNYPGFLALIDEAVTRFAKLKKLEKELEP